MDDNEREKQTCKCSRYASGKWGKIKQLTWVAIYAMEPGVTLAILWMHALLDLVALSTELGEVKTCL
jgi:hypothetical protein